MSGNGDNVTVYAGVDDYCTSVERIKGLDDFSQTGPVKDIKLINLDFIPNESNINGVSGLDKYGDIQLADAIFDGSCELLKEEYGVDPSVFIDSNNPKLWSTIDDFEKTIISTIDSLTSVYGSYTPENAFLFMCDIAETLNNIVKEKHLNDFSQLKSKSDISLIPTFMVYGVSKLDDVQGNKLADNIIESSCELLKTSYGVDLSLLIDSNNPELWFNLEELEQSIGDAINGLISVHGPYTSENAFMFIYDISSNLNKMAKQNV
ncbi:MAG: hypothetical protein GQ477_03345 [Nanohaloarchaea archaeon]|nr:hypothetical protein [Candidatus Nanohaloarchaea archaeon]